jgi:phage-related protein
MVKPWSHSKASRIFKAASSALAGVCILFLLGCLGSGKRTIVPVHGQVTYQGKPVAGATVEFLCDGASRPAVGMTDNEGTYQLTTFTQNDGAMVGTHVVTVNVYATIAEAALPVPKGTDSKATSKAIDEAVKQSLRNQAMAEKAPPKVPVKYTERRTSDLRKDVVKGDNVINIELSD